MKFDDVTDESIEVLVHAFYGKVRHDPQLAPIFTKALGDRWKAHIARMCAFWGAAMRIAERYRGDMLAIHRRVNGINPALIDHWLSLFEQTVEEHFTGAANAALRDRARKTARNLELALFHRADEAHGTVAPARIGFTA
ncbi:MAG: group III truncated hemoglobin [Stellaceae bacterium]